MTGLTVDARYAADDGSVPPSLAVVLAAHERGEAGLRDVVATLAGNRVLVPLLEVGGDQLDADEADPCAGGDRAVAAVSLRRRDGAAAGLAFTGMTALSRWDQRARPLPVAARQAAGAVLADGGRMLVVDPGSSHALTIEGAALARLAAGEPWPHPWADPAVRAAVVAELGPVLATGEIQVRLAAPPGDGPAGLVVGVRFSAALPEPVVQQRVAVLAERLSTSADLREVFDGTLAVQVL